MGLPLALAQKLDALRPTKQRFGAGGSVPDSSEFKRIAGLPSRELALDGPEVQDLVRDLTEVLKTPQGRQTLRPIQALALKELYERGGLFGPIRVGGGKSLITYLAPAILDAKRPLLLVPAKLKAKTRAEFLDYSKDWQGPHPETFRIESYELLGRASAGIKADGTPGLLERLRPDLLILDEAHKAKNNKAAVTKRIRRYLLAHKVPTVVLSGTMTGRSLREFSHLAAWALGDLCPVPRDFLDLVLWSQALDDTRTESLERTEPGALLALCTPEEREQGLDGVRSAVRRRIQNTPGVISTREGGVGCSLQINVVQPDAALDETFDPSTWGPVAKHLDHLWEEWETPDAHPVADPLAFRRHMREIALGFYYRWNPRPPEEWLEKRRQWAKVSREILKDNRRGLDSEEQAAIAVRAGQYGPEALATLQAWAEIRPTFKPHSEAVWFSDEAIDFGRAWAKSHVGIIWTEHVEFGRRLARELGLSYYGKGGQCEQSGRPIVKADPEKGLVASVFANGEGQNLQAWSRNLIFSIPETGTIWEQCLGRTHRDGQEADEVVVDYYAPTLASFDGFFRAKGRAQYMQNIMGNPQKLLLADLDLTLRGSYCTISLPGPRWRGKND
jgi:hypothetical protein